jgi:ribosomal protein S18 acetylase RimI-like enzyme
VPTRAEGPALEAMLAAWPAVEREPLGAWTLRFSGGFTGRSNSICAIGNPGLPLAQAVERCEAAYGRRDLPARFQLRDGHEVDGLEPLLRARGYRPERPALVLAGALPAQREDDAVVHAADPSPDWLATWLAIERGPEHAQVALPILERISRPRSFALLQGDDGAPLATALGTLSPGWLGLSCLAVLPEARRRGLAGRLLGALSAWAGAAGAARLWLEVEPGNETALGWYRRLGLEQVGAYGYLTAASIARTGS